MLTSLIRDLMRRLPGKRGVVAEASGHGVIKGPIRLHVGGQARHPDWKILDVRPGPLVDYVGSCTDLSRFADGSVLELYASHVLEHLGYWRELPAALHEFNRVLAAGGILRVSVPDLAILCSLYLEPRLAPGERFHVMRMMFGGQIDEADFHRVGLDEEMLKAQLEKAGFTDIVRVDVFGLFDDASSLVFKGRPISLNLRARKPPDA